MPIYSGSPILNNDEWILLQIKEGPCSAGCDYCYENEYVKKVFSQTKDLNGLMGRDLNNLSTIELSRLSDKNKSSLNLEMSIDEVSTIFKLLKVSSINRAGLIGSEPTQHSRFKEILSIAAEYEINLLVYTSGLFPEKLLHPSVKSVVLHLDYSRLGKEEMQLRVDQGLLPPDEYMKKIEKLLENNQEVYLRVNFTSSKLPESTFVMKFFDKIPPIYYPQLALKYSFSTRVQGDSSFDYFTPTTLKDTAHSLTNFVDYFNSHYSGVRMFSERPLFPCAFDEDTWGKYQQKGGFVSSCDMEFTFYPNSGVALCPPVRSLVQPKKVNTPEEFTNRILELRDKLRVNYLKPSFDVCLPCEHRKNLICQGGCLGYKC